MEGNNKSYFDKVSNNLSLTLGKQTEGITKSVSDTGKIMSNSKLSTSTKVAAGIVNGADIGIQAITTAISAPGQIAESVMLPMLAAVGMKGIASLPISKQLDPVMGIDVHMVTIPPSPAPVPMPHPYIGILMRPKDFMAAAMATFLPPPPLPPEATGDANADQDAATLNKAVTVAHTVATVVIGAIGATVKIGGFIPRAVAGTPTKSIPHFPMGAGFHPAFMAAVKKNQGHAFLGSLFALADSDPISGGGAHLHLNCNDVGTISIHDVRPSKNTDKATPTGASLYLPTGMITPIPPGRQIITNPMPAPFNPVALVGKMAKAALGRFFAKMQKKAAKKLHDVVNASVKNGKLNGMLHKAICTVTGHPVDVASGTFFTDEEDFSLPGPIPLSWERTWYSKSDYQGPLGYGWHHSYDIAMAIDPKTGTASLRLNDGRPVVFELPHSTLPSFNKAERLQLEVDTDGVYRVWNIDEDVFYYFTDKEYEGAKLLKSIVDRNAFSIRFEYDNNGYLQKITDSSQRVLTVENDTAGRILQIHAPHPTKYGETFAIATYLYDTQGNMTQQTNAAGDSMLFEYQGRLMVKETWRNGMNWFFKYEHGETGARCIHTWGDGDLYNHKLSYFEGKTIVENSLGAKTTYFHKGGLVYLKVDPNGAEHRSQYNEDNELLTSIDPVGNATLFTYDKMGNTIQTVNPEGGAQTLEYRTYNLKHLPELAIDANGGKWKWSYDENGNAIERINPLGAKSKMEYEEGLLTKLTNPLGNSTHLQYNSRYQVTQVLDEQGNRTSYEYDALGNCTKITNPLGATQERSYDLLGRVVKVQDFDGNEIQFKYDGIDNLLSYKDRQQEVHYEYKGLWKLTKRRDQRGTTYYHYNTEEQLQRIINEAGQPYTFHLDEVGDVVSEQGFDQKIKKYERDLAGRVTQLSLPSGKTCQYKYNKLGQVTQIIHSNKEEQTFAYNPAGKLTKAVNKDAEVAFAYNILGALAQETLNGHTLQNTYSPLGQRTALQSSMGAALSFEHDQFGYLAQLKAGQENNLWEAQYKYDKLGFEIERLLPGKLQQNFEYDRIGRLQSQLTLNGKQQRHQRRYTWGINDRLQKIDDSQNGTTTFGYTPTGHLEHAKYADGTEQFRKSDKVGNLFESLDQKDRVYGIGGRLEKKGSWIYKYDEDGYLTEKHKGSSGLFSGKKDHWKYAWNAEGMLQEVTRPDGEKVSFKYDALGRRISKQFKSTLTKWLWDGNVPLHEWKESAQSGQILGNSSIDSNGIITWVFEADSFVPTAKLRGNKKYSILTDHLGTPTQVYGEEGETIWQGSLDSFGRLRDDKGERGSCPFRYQGQYEDVETGLYYNRFRYFDPEEGRYVSKDPIGLLSGEFGFYNYVGDTNGWVDLFGQKPKSYGAYKTKDEAAEAVLKNANRRSIKKNMEFGGLIYELNGKFYPTRPIMGTKTSFKPSNAKHMVPKDAKIVGDYHTHGAEEIGYNSNEFSSADKRAHSYAPAGHTSYLGTPSAGFMKMTNGVISSL